MCVCVVVFSSITVSRLLGGISLRTSAFSGRIDYCVVLWCLLGCRACARSSRCVSLRFVVVNTLWWCVLLLVCFLCSDVSAWHHITDSVKFWSIDPSEGTVYSLDVGYLALACNSCVTCADTQRRRLRLQQFKYGSAHRAASKHDAKGYGSRVYALACFA